jgi:hypothetical protein
MLHDYHLPEMSLKHIPIFIIHSKTPKFESFIVLNSWFHSLLYRTFPCG